MQKKMISSSNHIRILATITILTLLLETANSWQNNNNPPCMDVTFPMGCGGTIGATSYTALDVDSFGNIVVGGQSTDIVVCVSSNTYPAPTIEFISSLLGYQWSNWYQTTAISVLGIPRSYTKIAAIKFTSNAKKITAVFDKPFKEIPLAIMMISVTDGSILNQYMEQTPLAAGAFSSPISTNSIVMSGNDVTGLALTLYNSWAYMLVNINQASSTITTSGYLHQTNANFLCGGAYAMINDQQSIYIAGEVYDGSNCQTGHIAKITENSGTYTMEWSISQSVNALTDAQININQLLLVSGNNNNQDTLYSCGWSFSFSNSKMQAYFQYNVLSNSGGNQNQPTSTTIAYYFDDNVNSQCLGLQEIQSGSGGGSQNVYALVSITSSTQSFLMLSLSTSGGGLSAQSYNLENRFDYVGNSVAQAIQLSSSQPYFIMAGSLKSYQPDTGPAISYTQNNGFVMLMTTSTGQYQQCITFSNIHFTGSSVITTVSEPDNLVLITTQASFVPIFSLSGSMTFSQSTSIIKETQTTPTHSQCALLMTATISATNPAPLTYDLLINATGSWNQQIQFATGPSCTAFTTFTMTVTPPTATITLSQTDNSQNQGQSQCQVQWTSSTPV